MGRTERDRWMRQFLAEGAEQQVRILAKLGDRLERGQDAADPKSTEPPTREWVRAFGLYQDGYRSLATLELEAAKLELLARRVTGKAPMSDDEYQAQLQALGRDAIGSLSAEELEAELARRQALPAPAGT